MVEEVESLREALVEDVPQVLVCGQSDWLTLPASVATSPASRLLIVLIRELIDQQLQWLPAA